MENGSYIGVPLLLALVVGAVALRRKRFALFCSIMAAIGLVMSLGPRLHVDGRRTGIPLPFDVITHVPLLNSSVSARWITYFWLFAALLLALVLDAVYRVAAQGRFGRRGGWAWSGALAVVVLLPLLPAWPYASAPADVPTWFTAGARSLPAGSAALVYPLASSTNDQSMLWQAMADMQFRMPGGFAVIPGPDGANTFGGEVTPLSQALAECEQGAPTVTNFTAADLQAQLRRWGTKTVAIVPSAPGAACATTFFTDALGPTRARRGRAGMARSRSHAVSVRHQAVTAEDRPGSSTRRADVGQHGGMAHDRKFRFAAQLSKAPDGTARSWAEQARRVEDLGYSALLMPDHFGDQLAPVPALAAAAAATTSLRIGSLVFGNDYRHPFVLAKEAATLDVLSGGRFEMSLGAGWMRTDYDEAGLTYDHPAVRVTRFEEAVKVVQGLLRTDGPYHFHGEHYEVLGHTLTPRPVQQPGPPLIIGGGGKRVLSFAARHADIVSINVNLREGTGGAETAADATPGADPDQGRLGQGGGRRPLRRPRVELAHRLRDGHRRRGRPGRADGVLPSGSRPPTRCTFPWR